MKKILLVEPDKELSELFANWLEGEKYKVKPVDDQEQVFPLLSGEKFDLLVIDIDFPVFTETLIGLCQRLKKDLRFSDLPVAVFTYKKDGKKISSAIEAGVDNFMLKPFETDSFLKRIQTIFKEIELKKQGKKVLDLNYINFLIQLASGVSRKDFFLLVPTIFNRLIMDKVKDILGEPVVMVIAKRLKKLSEENHKFMREVKFSGMQFLMDGVDKASKGVPVERLAVGFGNYVYAFLNLVRVLTSDILMERGKW